MRQRIAALTADNARLEGEKEEQRLTLNAVREELEQALIRAEQAETALAKWENGQKVWMGDDFGDSIPAVMESLRGKLNKAEAERDAAYRDILDARDCGSANHCPFCGAYNVSGFQREEEGSAPYEPHRKDCICLVARAALAPESKENPKLTPDTQVQIRFGRLCSLVMAAISYGVRDRECLVPEVATSKAAEFISALVKNGEVIPALSPRRHPQAHTEGGGD